MSARGDLTSIPVPHRVALIKPSALGDIVHALPVLTALREHWPQAHLTWVVNAGYAPMLEGHPHLDAILPFDRGAFRKGLGTSTRYALSFTRRLRRERFDLVIDLQGLLRTGLMTAASGAKVKVGFAAAREGASWMYTHRIAVPDADRIHAVDRYWRVVEALGAGQGPKRFLVPVQEREVAAVDAEFAHLPRPWLALAVGSRWVTKCWPPGHFATLARQAQQEFGGTVLFVGTAEDREKSLEVAGQLTGPWQDLTGATSLPRLTALLSRVDVMVANDTGPLHLAAALGRPCVAPYTCTKVALHGPYGTSGAGIATTVPCAGSYLKRCPHGMICMNDLTPDKLWPTLHEVLRPWPTLSPSA